LTKPDLRWGAVATCTPVNSLIDVNAHGADIVKLSSPAVVPDGPARSSVHDKLHTIEVRCRGGRPQAARIARPAL